ncbi:hypothetical protein [Sphingomonas sp. 3-13AW]|uniref:hypothetical protein n=1 Tax=Sphingomonas sp. 3-13AW TaxID=3050450 RepID=UPI003BB6F592
MFDKLSVCLCVDIADRAASGTVSYNGRIMRMITERDAPFGEVNTPEKAQAWMKRPMGERGNLMEHLEWQARTGLLQPETSLSK